MQRKEAIPFVPLCPQCRIQLPYQGAAHLEQDQCELRVGSVPRDPIEWTVYSQYAPYPTLFGRSPWSRWFIFDHLFFGYGAGYEWVNGELRDVTNYEVAVGDAVQWRTFEEEDAEILGEMPLFTGRDAEKKTCFEEECRQHTREMLLNDRAQFEKKPQKWLALSNSSPIFTVPEDATLPWLVAACDATQMFLRGEAFGQSLRQVYLLIEQRACLFARVGLPLPRLEETRMTTQLLSLR